MAISGDGSTLVASSGTSVEVIDVARLAHVGDVHPDITEARNTSIPRLAVNSDGTTIATVRCHRERDCEYTTSVAQNLTPAEHEIVETQMMAIDVATGGRWP
jgi:hypothetical protein